MLHKHKHKTHKIPVDQHSEVYINNNEVKIDHLRGQFTNFKKQPNARSIKFCCLFFFPLTNIGNVDDDDGPAMTTVTAVAAKAHQIQTHTHTHTTYTYINIV